MHLNKILYSPEGESGTGGGQAVIDAPASAPAGTPDISQMDMGDAIASVFKTEPRQKREQKKPADKAPAKDAPKADAAPKPEAPPAAEPEKRTSIFQAPPEKKPETPQTVDISEAADDAIPENDWKAAKAARKQLRQEITAREERLKKAEQELASYHELVPDVNEVKRVREEHKAFSEKVALLDYQSHPEFRRQFVEPKEKLNGEIKTILADNGIENFDLKAITALPRAEMAKRISEVTDKLNSFDAGEFRLQLREYQKISEAERGALANHGEALKNINQANQAKQRSAFESRWKTTSLANFAQKLDPAADAAPEKVSRIKSLNEGIDGIRQVAEKYAFAIADEGTAADVAIKAANYDFVVNHAFPSMQSDYQELVAQNKSLTKKLEELAAHKPGAGFDGSATANKSESLGEMDIKSAVKKVFRS